jgi:antitoxin MazE
MCASKAHISPWCKGLSLRLTKRMVKLAGVCDGTPVRVVVKPGHTVVETETEATLEAMLAAFDPQRHSGEVMGGLGVYI